MKCGVILATLFLVSSAYSSPIENGRIRKRFDSNWRFRLETADPLKNGQEITRWRYVPVKPRSAEDDPANFLGSHDASIGQPLRDRQDVFEKEPGVAWFRAELPGRQTLPPGSNRILRFASADDNAVVYVNGKKLINHIGWNMPFEVILDPVWRENGPNVVWVRLENTAGPGGLTGAVTLGTMADTDNSPFTRPDYDDKRWRTVTLPHDYVIEGRFDPKATMNHGFLPMSPAWYRKTFSLPENYKGKSIWLDFDGVYRDSIVYLNGKRLGRHPSGYIGFRYDIGSVAHFGRQKNVLSVAMDPRKFEGWYYEGGGIYRHVWLNIADRVHITPWGTAIVSTVRTEGGSVADLVLRTNLNNRSRVPRDVTLVSQIQDAKGKTVVTTKTSLQLTAGKRKEITQETVLGSAHLWSLQSPYLYRMRSEIRDNKNNALLDAVETPFGVRTVRFDANQGFFLNGKPIKLKGVCCHQDFPGVGIGAPDSLHAERIRALKGMGANAYRAAHHPPSPELLDACDRLGVLVLDENRHLGDSYTPKSPVGTGYSDLSDLAALVQRDRNHPSVFAWSLGNEEEDLQGTEEGIRIVSAMKAMVHRYDTSRPVTVAMNGSWGEGIATVLDIQGCNYSPANYDKLHQKRPDLPIFGSETASTTATRGVYETDPIRKTVSAYDLNHPFWGNTAEEAWKAVMERPFIAGAFVWTGVDYKGEPAPYEEWPSVNSYYGILDLCGFPKDNYFYYKAWWQEKTPLVHLLPHWNWAGRETQVISVWCYGNTESVELLLNGSSLGVKPMPRLGHLEWSVPYTPGRLEAHGMNGGKVITTHIVETTGPPTALRLTRERATPLTADGEEIVSITVDVVDAQGRIVPTASPAISFTITGSGTLAGVGNGDPTSHEPDQSNRRNAFGGRCLVLVRAGIMPGQITLKATADGMIPAVCRMNVRQDDNRTTNF